MPKGERKKRKPNAPRGWQVRFLEKLSQNGVISYAAEFAGVSVSWLYDWRDAHPDFNAALERAQRIGAETCLEREAHRRAVDGWDEPVFGKLEKYDVLEEGMGGAVVTYTGEVGRIRKFDSGLLALLLKGAMPDKYGTDRKKTEHSGAVAIVPRTLADEIAAARAARPVEPPAVPAPDLAPE